jgi:major vault protein
VVPGQPRRVRVQPPAGGPELDAAGDGGGGSGRPVAAAGPREAPAPAAKAATGAIAARETQAAPPPPTEFAGDDFNRNQNFTGPRTIVLDTRFEGAVAIDVWTGYAVLVVSKTGERQVVSGPHSRLLEYDENLQALELSTGTPKTDANLIKTVYLRTLNNKVTDVVEAETLDLVRVHLQLSYRVNFEGDPARWFEVENYVKFLTDHLRSLIRHAVKRHGIEHFYANAVTILRDIVLGVVAEDGKRPGRRFDENGMRIYDVEVLEVAIGDETIAEPAGQGPARGGAADAAAGGGAAPARGDAPERGDRQQIAELQSQTRQKQQRPEDPRGRAAAAPPARRAGGEDRAARAPADRAAERAGAGRDDPRGRAGAPRAAQDLELAVAQGKLDQRLASWRRR